METPRTLAAARAGRSDRNDAPTTSVVVPNWNGRWFLVRCLAALRRQTYPSLEVIVVDGGSSDGSVETVRAEFPEVRVIALDRNVGFAAACNKGARAGEGAYVAFLNNDTEPSPTWLEEHVACLERHPRAASVACRSLRLGDEGTIDGAGDEMTWSLKAYRRGAREPDGPRYNVEEQVFSASGTGCLWRADVFAELGGFDEDFFAYYEDVDLGFRARLAGYECWYAPRAVLAHVGAGAASALPTVFDTSLSVRNRWATAIKNAPGVWFLRYAPAIAFGEALWLARSATRGDLLAHLAAYRRVARELPTWLEKRRLQQRSARAEHLTARALRPLPPVAVAASRPLSRAGVRSARRRVERLAGRSGRLRGRYAGRRT